MQTDIEQYIVKSKIVHEDEMYSGMLAGIKKERTDVHGE
jgi:hypothetical protein